MGFRGAGRHIYSKSNESDEYIPVIVTVVGAVVVGSVGAVLASTAPMVITNAVPSGIIGIA